MIIYNQTSTTKKYVGGMLIGVLILPAVGLFIQGYILAGILLTLTYLLIETSRTGVEFDFHEVQFIQFRELLFFIKIPLSKVDLNNFSHYRIKLQDDETTIRANWTQYSTVSQEYYILELLERNKGKFIEIVKSESGLIQPIIKELELSNIFSLM